MARKMVVTATGDSLISRRMPEYPDDAFQGMLKLIRSADVAFTNMEMTLTDSEGVPVVESGGVNISAPPGVAKDLQNMGFNLTAFANNHTLNYGEYGCTRTLEVLKELEFVCAGAGRHLAEARQPAYLETPVGRVGLMGCASSFAPGQRAGAQRYDAQGRPGVNPQRFDVLYQLDQEHYDAIKRIADKTGAEAMRQYRLKLGFGKEPKREGEFQFADKSFIVGDEFRIRTEAHQADLEGNTASISDAAELSNLTIASIHAHEPNVDMSLPADFIEEFAHACIDAGADVVFGHGPHMLRGLEIYKGKPIFYSLGNFIFQHEYQMKVPADDYETIGVDTAVSPLGVYKHLTQGDTRSFISIDRYWETVLPMITFEDRELKEITLHPVTLGPGTKWPERGTPRLAERDHGEKILEYMTELSGAYGTEIVTKDGIGHVTLS